MSFIWNEVVFAKGVHFYEIYHFDFHLVDKVRTQEASALQILWMTNSKFSFLL